MKLSAAQRVERTHVRLMGHKATMAFSSIFMVGDTKIVDDIPTARTNGRDVEYGEPFVDSIDDRELAGVVLHENMHKVYQHAWLWKHLWVDDAKLANMSCDYVINLEILDLSKKHPDLLTLPAMALLDEQYRGMDTGEVFRKLKEQGEGQGQGQGQGGFDTHNFDELSDAEAEATSNEVDQALRQGALLAGKMGGDESRLIGELTAPRVDWREQLREFVSSVTQGRGDATWRRPHRRWLGEDLYMPSPVTESIGCVAVAIDTSGSVRGELVSAFLSEVVGIGQNVAPETLHLLQCDYIIQSHKVYDQTSLQIGRAHV